MKKGSKRGKTTARLGGTGGKIGVDKTKQSRRRADLNMLVLKKRRGLNGGKVSPQSVHPKEDHR